MNINELKEKLEIKTLTNIENNEIKGVFISDMLSDVMSSAKPQNLWITVQTHKNIVSASNLIDISGIIITHNKKVPQETIDLANKFHVNILLTSLSTFEIISKLITLGVNQ